MKFPKLIKELTVLVNTEIKNANSELSKDEAYRQAISAKLMDNKLTGKENRFNRRDLLSELRGGTKVPVAKATQKALIDQVMKLKQEEFPVLTIVKEPSVAIKLLEKVEEDTVLSENKNNNKRKETKGHLNGKLIKCVIDDTLTDLMKVEVSSFEDFKDFMERLYSKEGAKFALYHKQSKTICNEFKMFDKGEFLKIDGKGKKHFVKEIVSNFLLVHDKGSKVSNNLKDALSNIKSGNDLLVFMESLPSGYELVSSDGNITIPRKFTLRDTILAYNEKSDVFRSYSDKAARVFKVCFYNA